MEARPQRILLAEGGAPKAGELVLNVPAADRLIQLDNADDGEVGDLEQGDAAGAELGG